MKTRSKKKIGRKYARERKIERERRRFYRVAGIFSTLLSFIHDLHLNPV